MHQSTVGITYATTLQTTLQYSVATTRTRRTRDFHVCQAPSFSVAKQGELTLEFFAVGVPHASFEIKQGNTECGESRRESLEIRVILISPRS
jgi:hypothetical protein